MTDSSEESKFYVPSFIRRTFKGLLLPGQELEQIFEDIGGLILEGSNEIRPDETVWGSETMILNHKKPRTLDMFFKKVIKTEPSDIDSNYNESVTAESSRVKKFKSSPDSITKISSEKKNKKTLMSEKNGALTPTSKLKHKIKSRQHSISSSEDEPIEKNTRNSPSYSVDLFTEEIQENSGNPNKTNSDNSLSDEEIIPSSQVLQSSSKSSITPLKKSSAGVKYSQSTKDSTSSLSLSNKSSVTERKELSSSSSEDEHDEQPVMSKLDSIKNKMKNIKEVFSDVESNTDKFNFGDLTEDDEVYILQCPREIDSKKLEGVELTLKGNSVVSVEGSKYDCFALKENSKRSVYIALPDSNEQGIKLGAVQLAGNIILSENLGIPYSKPIEDDAQEDVTLEISNTPLNEESTSQHALKKKKKHRNTDDTISDETAATDHFSKDVTDVLNQLASKKKKRKHTSLESSDIDSVFSELESVNTECEDLQIIPDTEDQEISLKKKKKKKRNNEGKDINSSFSDISIKTDLEDPHIIPDTQDQETSLNKKKKKKRSSEGEDSNASFLDSSKAHIVKTDLEDSEIIPDTQDQETPLKSKKKKRRSKEGYEYSTQDEATESEFFSDNVTDVLNKLASKKKKRKHYSLGSNSSGLISNEVTDHESEFDKFLKIKTELEEPQVVSDFLETPSKSKKRSRKDMEDSEEFSKDVPKKKKKNQHSYSENEDML